MIKLCSKCKNPISDEMKFCVKCGSPVGKVSADVVKESAKKPLHCSVAT